MLLLWVKFVYNMNIRSNSNKAFLQQPFSLFIHLVLLGIVILFCGLIAAYLFAGNQSVWVDFKLPNVFWLSSVFALGTSWTLKNMLKSYSLESNKDVIRFLFIALSLSLLFLCCQWLGWRTMHNEGLDLSGSPSEAYVYVISGLHALHVVVGVILIFFAIIRSRKYLVDPATSLVFFSDSGKELKLRLLANYWHTIDFLWLFLFFAFLYRHA